MQRPESGRRGEDDHVHSIDFQGLLVGIQSPERGFRIDLPPLGGIFRLGTKGIGHGHDLGVLAGFQIIARRAIAASPATDQSNSKLVRAGGKHRFHASHQGCGTDQCGLGFDEITPIDVAFVTILTHLSMPFVDVN